MASVSGMERKIACNACRRRKTACDRTRPRCNLCARGNFDCVYNDHARQPGLRAGYVNQLERRIQSLEQRLSHVETELRISHATTLERSAERGHVDADMALPPLNDTDQSPVGHDDHEIELSPARQDLLPHETDFPRRNVHPQEAGLLSMAVIYELKEVWFTRYHPWFPVLHQPSYEKSLEVLDLHQSTDFALVVQAIVAVTLQHSHVIDGGAEWRQERQHHLVNEIIAQCVGRSSLLTVQALLILSVLEYGKARHTASWNILAIARRIGVQLRLGSVTASNLPTATSPTSLRRLPAFVNTTVSQEERIRAYWMIEVLESISTIGSPSDTGLRGTPGDPLLPCSDALWKLDIHERVFSESQTRPMYYCSAFSLCIILAASELTIVHRFLQRPVMMLDFEERDAWQSEAQQIDERLTAWRDEFVAAVFRLINAEKMDQRRAEMDAYVVLTNCVLNTAVITLLQQRTTCPAGIDQTVEPWAFANTRCVYACENTAYKIRQMDEEELLVCHPHLIISIFAAARFYLVHSKALDANVPTNLHALAFALHTCGKTWPLARTYEHILRIAVAEYRTPIVQSRVPGEFYDLRITTFDVSEALIAWAEGPGADITPSLEHQNEPNGALEFMPMVVNVLA